MSAHTTSVFRIPRSPTPMRPWHALARRLAAILEARRGRRALAEMDPRMLRDIGLSRCDVDAELRRVFWDIHSLR